MHLHGQADPNPNAVFVANLYSRALDYWGVDLQRAGLLAEAADAFTSAHKINPDNVVAEINLEFNRTLQSGDPVKVEPGRVNADEFGKSRNWNALMNANGPFDDPSFLFVNSALIARSGLMRQTIAPFNRVCQLAPDFLPARIWLAQLYLYNRLSDQALNTLHEPLTQPKRFGLNTTNSTGVNTLAAFAHLQKNEPKRGVEMLEQEISLHPDDTNLLTTVAQALFTRGLFSDALHVIDRRLAQVPDDPQWLFGKGFASLQMSNYNQAITAFTRVQEISTNDPMSRFYRAYAYLQTDRLNDARADYAALENSYTNSFQIEFGLGEVAWRQHNTNEAISRYEQFLSTAPTNAAEIKVVRERLTELRGK